MKPEELATKIETVEASLLKALEVMEQERKEHGEVAEETGKRVNELTESLAGLKEQVDTSAEDAKAAAEEREKFITRIDELETQLKRDGDLSGKPEDMRSPGEIFTSSDEYKRLVAENALRCAPVKMKSFFPGVQFGLKTNFLSTPPERLVMPDRIEDIFTPQLRQLRMRDLIPVRSTQSNAIEYIREAGFNTGGAVSVTAIVVASGVATVTQTAHGFAAGDRVRIAGVTDETDLNGDQWVVSVTDADTYTFDTTAGDTAGAAGTITAIDLQVHGAAAETAEAADKPEAQLDMELLTEAIQTIAHFLPASRQILMDHGQMEAYINDRLRYGVMFREDSQLLYGTGASPQIQGILTELGTQRYLWSSGTTGDTKIDAIRRGMTQAHVQEYAPTALVVNPNDWEDIQLEKGTDDHYIWASVASGTGMVFFLLPVVVTNAINVTDALVGSFALGSTIWDREQAIVRVSDSHDDFFIKNLVALLGEERMCQTIYRPDAFVNVQFDSAP